MVIFHSYVAVYQRVRVESMPVFSDSSLGNHHEPIPFFETQRFLLSITSIFQDKDTRN